MNLDLVRKKLGKLYVDGHIPTKDFDELSEMLDVVTREYIRCQYRIDERVLALLGKEVA